MNSSDHPSSNMPFREFVALMVLLMSLTALCIDSMLPMLGVIGDDLQVANANHTQHVVNAMLLGFTFGQIIYGPLSDNFGRKNMIYIGMLIFSIGNLVSLVAGNFELLLFGRVLQGLGSAASRVVTVAMVRDCYSGRDMARVTSIIMGAFILVPIVAPNIGQAILIIGHWRHIFVLFLIAAVVGVAWMHFRLDETFPKEKRQQFKLKVLWHGVREVLTNRTTRSYMLCSGLVFGGLMGYLTSAQQIFQDYFNTGQLFSVYFACLAFAAGCASFVNSRIVKLYGMCKITRYAHIGMISSSAVFVSICMFQPNVPLVGFMIYAVITFFSMGLLFGNINAIAMEPMGHIAGIASAVIGTFSSAVSLTIGALIGLSFNMTLLPVSIGFLVTASAGFLIQTRIERSTA